MPQKICFFAIVMSLYIASLNSGSNGNCYYIGNGQEAVLVDAGLSCRETEKRMKRMGLSLQKVKAIFISHEHSDHIKGVTVLSKKYQIPVYITTDTMRYGRLFVEEHLVRAFTIHEPVAIGGLLVTAFPKLHDASDPHSFIVAGNDKTIGVFTDIGASCQHVVRYFGLCDAAFLESNYDEEMLDKGRYPIYLKNRIRGGLGHLSNRQALELFLQHRSPNLSHLLLAHLSQENNCPHRVHELFSEYADLSMEVVVASRYHETQVYQVGGVLQPASAIAMRQAALF